MAASTATWTARGWSPPCRCRSGRRGTSSCWASSWWAPTRRSLATCTTSSATPTRWTPCWTSRATGPSATSSRATGWPTCSATSTSTPRCCATTWPSSWPPAAWKRPSSGASSMTSLRGSPATPTWSSPPGIIARRPERKAPRSMRGALRSGPGGALLHHAGGDLESAGQGEVQLGTAGQRPHARRRAGQHHVARLQSEVATHLRHQGRHGEEHVGALAALMRLTVDLQGEGQRAPVGHLGKRQEGRQRTGTVEGLGGLPGVSLLLEAGLQVAQGQVQPQADADDGALGLVRGGMGELLADQQRQLGLVVHLAPGEGGVDGLLQRDGAGGRLDEQQRLAGHRIVELPGMIGIVAADADDLAERVGKLLAIGKTWNKAHGGSSPSRFACRISATSHTVYRTMRREPLPRGRTGCLTPPATSSRPTHGPGSPDGAGRPRRAPRSGCRAGCRRRRRCYAGPATCRRWSRAARCSRTAAGLRRHRWAPRCRGAGPGWRAPRGWARRSPAASATADGYRPASPPDRARRAGGSRESASAGR